MLIGTVGPHEWLIRLLLGSAAPWEPDPGDEPALVFEPAKQVVS